MNKEYDIYRSCTSKLAHKTKTDAENHIDILVLRGTPRASLGIYKCKHCKKFHVTSGKGNYIHYKKKKRKSRRKA